MRWKLLRRAGDAINNKLGGEWSQLMLWAIWTLAVAATAYLNWHADVVAQRPLNLLGLIIRSALIGMIGLVALTVVELWLEPWRFMD